MPFFRFPFFFSCLYWGAFLALPQNCKGIDRITFGRITRLVHVVSFTLTPYLPLLTLSPVVKYPKRADKIQHISVLNFFSYKSSGSLFFSTFNNLTRPVLVFALICDATYKCLFNTSQSALFYGRGLGRAKR